MRLGYHGGWETLSISLVPFDRFPFEHTEKKFDLVCKNSKQKKTFPNPTTITNFTLKEKRVSVHHGNKAQHSIMRDVWHNSCFHVVDHFDFQRNRVPGTSDLLLWLHAPFFYGGSRRVLIALMFILWAQFPENGLTSFLTCCFAFVLVF